MEKQKKVERWSYPFKAKGSNGGASSEITDPQVYYDALAKAGSGFYPVSSNGLWHGGVHFDQNTGAQLDQSSVRCIADGEVVAYRIDGKYKTLTYGEGASAHETIYSTGFVLVRHRLELPPAPAPATPAAGGTQPAATPPAAEPDLTFYSLYMHLMDWQGYQDKPELERPAFWAGDTRTVKQSAPDKLQGLRVRATPNGTVLGVLPRGTLVEAEAAGPGINPNWLKFIRATPAVAGLAENTGYLHKGPADGSVLKALGEGRYIVNHKAKDPIEPAQKGANIRSAANGNSPILGLLPAGTQVRVSPTATTKSYHKLLAITQGSATPAVSAEQLASEGYVWVKDLEAIKEPQARDSVFLVEPPVPIQAGALIGHLGKYQAATQGAPQDLLHLEVFTCDDMEAFVTQSRARAKQLKPEQKTLLKIPSETKLITREDATQENPPQVSDPGQPTAYDMILPLAVLEALPAERKITLTTTTGGTTTTERWWKLENMPGKDGQPIGGWVKEDELITPRLHPWDWEGFDFIKETSTLSDQYACKLSTDGVLDDGEKTNYQAQIDQGDSGPIKERLYDIIDTNNDEKLTPEEIRNALSKPWHAQSISRLIVQYESEWYADPGLSKWEALNCYMTKEGEKDWAKEKERIKSLLWWDNLQGIYGLNGGAQAWHFHPCEAVSNFTSACIPLVRAQEIALLVSSGYEGSGSLDFEALAGNFDNQGMSFGVIQWNFGQGTLGPVLKEMRDLDGSTFDSCFENNMNLQELIDALDSGSKTAQYNWATNIQETNYNGWKNSFKNIGHVEKFKLIQLKHAAKYHDNVMSCIELMRELSSTLMNIIDLRTYVALYDLCVQQNNLNKAKVEITEGFSITDISTQKDLLIYVVQKRAEKASSIYVADALSRRMGIIHGSAYTATANGITATRSNPNFSRIIEGKVCEI